MLCIASGLKAQVSGVVFRDFDMNGVRSDSIPNEVGVAGIRVRAFVDLNKIPILTVTGADGSYSFSSSAIPPGLPVRVEFDSLVVGDYNGPFGTSSATSVQFIKTPAININLGINYPSDYCQPPSKGLWLVTPCYVNGNSLVTIDGNGNSVPDDKQTAKSDALVGVEYMTTGIISANNFPPKHLALASQIGSVWALAYQRRTKKLFTATVIKRHMSFGPLGSGGIYATDMTTNTTSSFIDVRTIGIDTGDDPHSGLFGDKTQPSTDSGPVQAMGRSSFGGMTMSEDDKTLYFVNLKDRRLYSLFIDSPARTPTAADVKSWAIPDPGCSNGDFRPWAVKMYHGKLYIGVICSAETSQQQSDLKATIYKVDPTVANPVFETVLSFPIDFRRGPADNTYDPASPDVTCLKYDHWLPWTNAWPAPCGQGLNPYFVMLPQPILSDLEFDEQGSMIIGFMDRFGYLTGIANHDPQGNGSYDGFSGGDLLKAYNNNGTFELEKNGKVGNQTGSGVSNNEGPVDSNGQGGEFFGEDVWMFLGHPGHSEVTNGALSYLPGYREITTSAFDPISDIYKSAGLKVFDAYNGTTKRNSVIYTLTDGSFGKAAGLGDNVILCDPAPVEIGNRIWFDDNRDGIQDAYEPGVDGIVITLHDMENGGAQIASQTTHDGGQFYFNNTTVPSGLVFDHKYEMRMDTAQLPLLDITLGGVNQITPAGGRLAARGARVAAATAPRHYFISPANRSDGSADSYLRDSDGKLVGSSAVITVTTQNAGQNDFTYDLSVYSCPELMNEKDTITVCEGSSVGSIATATKHLSRVDSVRYVLFTSPQSGTAMYANTGTILGTAYPDSVGRIALANPAINTVNVPRQYVYALVYPTPENPVCRQSGETVIDVTPGYSVTAVGGELTCTVLSATLTGQALRRDGSPATDAIYAWTGPNSFTSAVQNPVVTSAGTYTLTVTNPNCPDSFTATTAQVTSNTVSPTLSTSLSAKLCSSCSATLTASSTGATLSWTGPNGFTAVGSPVVVTTDGVYIATATSANGCTAVSNLTVLPYGCPPLSASVTGGELTCSVRSLTLTSVALNSDGSVATTALYNWTGPNGFTSSAQNPVVTSAGNYSLTVSNPTCPTLLTGLTTQVLSNTVTPAISTSLVAKTCETCMATLSVTTSPGATYDWTGPNGFTSNSATTQAAADGTYVVTVTGSNNCRIAANLLVVPFDCPPALTRCIPVVIRRVR
jgi:hypothetical protein